MSIKQFLRFILRLFRDRHGELCISDEQETREYAVNGMTFVVERHLKEDSPYTLADRLRRLLFREV